MIFNKNKMKLYCYRIAKCCIGIFSNHKKINIQQDIEKYIRQGIVPKFEVAIIETDNGYWPVKWMNYDRYINIRSKIMSANITLEDLNDYEGSVHEMDVNDLMISFNPMFSELNISKQITKVAVSTLLYNINEMNFSTINISMGTCLEINGLSNFVFCKPIES